MRLRTCWTHQMCDAKGQGQGQVQMLLKARFHLDQDEMQSPTGGKRMQSRKPRPPGAMLLASLKVGRCTHTDGAQRMEAWTRPLQTHFHVLQT